MREQVYRRLIENRGRFVSGEELAGALNISRMAVSKHIAAIRADGGGVRSRTNSGYMLEGEADPPRPEYVAPLLDFHANVIYRETVASTQSFVRAAADDGADEWTVAFARTQTAGKGRRGRTWQSSGKGIYMSVLLRPRVEDVQGITVLMAVAVARVLEGLGVKPGIKWPNDVLVGGKKICGILTEGSFGLDNVGLDYLVCGAGLNVHESAEELAAIDKPAISLNALGVDVPRSVAAAHTLNQLYRLYADFCAHGLDNILDEYAALSVHTGKEVTLTVGDKRITGAFRGFDRDGSIRIERGGVVESCFAGEIEGVLR